MAKPKFDPRKIMEQAVQVMLDSVAEPRTDGKASPKVGAVLVKPNGDVDTACRGELRNGDHAEFTLLERKNRDTKLDGGSLFATLEPCAPGARNPPKCSCAERIVNARISEVWVGIEDPDPTVDRKGIKYLQDNGVAVHMFDRDLQERIREANEHFLEQALERAAAREAEIQPIVLSPLEGASPKTPLHQLSKVALESYREQAGLPKGEAALYQRLMQQGLLVEQAKGIVPTGFGALLFGEAPRALMPQAGLLATIHYADGTEEKKDFEGPMVEIPAAALGWLNDKLPNVIDRTAASHTTRNPALFELVREGIVNALVHRDYDVEGAKCHLVVRPGTIEIRSPGMPVEPITLEQMRSFSAPLLSRNPVLHYVFAKMKLAEERGLGLKSMKEKSTQAGLPVPKYSWEDPYLVLTIFRNAAAVVASLPATILSKLNADEIAVWKLAHSKIVATSRELSNGTGFNEKKTQRIIRRLEDLGLLLREGKARATYYVALRL